MAKGSTFPADDVPDRTHQVLDVLRRHDPVPVPTTALYLAIPDKRALADEFARLRGEGLMELAMLKPGDPQFEAAAALTGVPESARVPLAVFRLTGAGRR